MDGIAWDKIIGAAAQSTLGILSLGIILVGVLAYLFFGKSDDRVKLWVFAGIFVAVIGLGIAILHESRNEDAAPQPNTGLATTSASEVAISEAPASEQATDNLLPVEPNAASSEASPSIAGTWRDDPADGFEFVITTTGNQFSYTQTQGGVPAGGGHGTIAGRKLTYSYKTADGSGRCSTQIDPAGTTMTGFCQDGARRWSVRFVRVDAA